MDYPTNRNFEQRVTNFIPYMRKCFHKCVWQSADIEDLVVETMLSLCNDENKVKMYSDSKLRNLVYLRCETQLIRWLRKNGPQKRSGNENLQVTRTVMLEDFNSESGSSWQEYLSDQAAPNPTPELLGNILVQKILETLPPLQREIVQKTVIESEAVSSIAARRSKSPAWIQKQRNQALKTLRKRLSLQGFAYEPAI